MGVPDIKRSLVAAAACLLLAAGASAGARAADMSGGYPPPSFGKPKSVAEFVSGWYLRGDLGYRYNRMSGIDAAPAVVAYSIDDRLAIGGGIGYKYHWLRADVTLDYGLRSHVSGDVAGTAGFYSGRLDSLTALFNGYVDFGSWDGLTPYVGAGIGASRLNLAEYRTLATVPPTLIPNTQTWQFSWAWMAGFSYQFMPNLSLDVGYRYLRLGNAFAGPDAIGNTVSFRGLSAQEIRVGLRFTID